VKKSKLSWKTDENGRVLRAHIHDGQLVGVSFSDKDTLSFRIHRVDGGEVLIDLNSPEDMTLELWNGAIVSECFIWKVDSVPPSSWKIPDSGWNALYGSRCKPEDIKTQAEKIIKKAPESFLVQLACSYGGGAAAVCSRVSIYEELK
jgi:hypothetical protein